MDEQSAQQRIIKLRETINHHNYLYHVLDRPQISDAVFDGLKKELKRLEDQYPQLITPDSPTQRVGGHPLDKFKKVKHLQPMLSIDDIFEPIELERWSNYLERFLGQNITSFFCEQKIDGLAARLVYHQGTLIQGATRGDGSLGEDVTANLKTVRSIPLVLSRRGSLPKDQSESLVLALKNGRIEVRGEVYLDRKDFEEFNNQRLAKGEAPYANSRNLAAGSVRQLDPHIARSRPLKFMAYGLIADLGQKTHSQEHQILKALGFRVDPGRICRSTDEVIKYWQETDRLRADLAYQIDGLVVTVDNKDLFNALGNTGKSPRGVRALKFAPSQATTRVKNIKLQVGRTGAVTPVAYLEPVKLSGVTIARATLHNFEEIERLELKIGDTVVIERSGDVIPKIVKVLKELRNGSEQDFVFKQICPSCQHQLIRPPDEVVWRCINTACPARCIRFLSHFVSRAAFDITGLGPQLLEKLVQANLVKTADDIFRLKAGSLTQLEGLGPKSASKLIESINSARQISFDRFLIALSLPRIGNEKARQLAVRFNSFPELLKASQEELEELPDFGEETAIALRAWLTNSANLDLVKRLFDVGVEIVDDQRPINNRLKGQKFVLTGTLSEPRSVIKQRIESYGGRVVDHLSKQVDYLIVGQNPGRKVNQARAMGLKILSEADLEKLIS